MRFAVTNGWVLSAGQFPNPKLTGIQTHAGLKLPVAKSKARKIQAPRQYSDLTTPLRPGQFRHPTHGKAPTASEKH
jgi:hypothetical protein